MSKDNVENNCSSIDTLYLQVLIKFPIKRKEKNTHTHTFTSKWVKGFKKTFTNNGA
jgi:hypothetical protein